MPKKKEKSPTKPKAEAATKAKPFACLPLVPDRFYRKSEVVENRYLGWGFTMLDEKIKAGEIAPPISLSHDGRACGWFGRYLMKLQRDLLVPISSDYRKLGHRVAAAQAAAWGNSTAMRFAPLVSTIATRI